VSFAEACAQAGADAFIAARRVEKIAATAQLVTAAGRLALSVQTDVTDPDQCAAIVDAAIAEFGRVDGLVNNAGVGTAVPTTRETAEEFRAVVGINLNGCYWAAQACGGVFVTGQTIVVDGGVTVA
jgi:NAD(P)-dependent dehydrogenase (short-subunit alcohol dehydrogenase family)